MAERNANSVREEAIERTRRVSQRSLQNLVPYKKRQTGNPGGKTKLFAQVQRICREASPEAARRLIELMHSEDERVALMAADKVFERAWGRPKEYDPNAESTKKPPPPFDPSLYTTEELRRMQEVMLMIAERQGMVPPEAAAPAATAE
jgi:hypothetical protein